MALKALWLIKLYGLIESTMALSLQVVKKREVFRSSMTSLRQLKSTMALSFEKRNDFLETKTSFKTNVMYVKVW